MHIPWNALLFAMTMHRVASFGKCVKCDECLDDRWWQAYISPTPKLQSNSMTCYCCLEGAQSTLGLGRIPCPTLLRLPSIALCTPTPLITIWWSWKTLKNISRGYGRTMLCQELRLWTAANCQNTIQVGTRENCTSESSLSDHAPTKSICLRRIRLRYHLHSICPASFIVPEGHFPAILLLSLAPENLFLPIKPSKIHGQAHLRIIHCVAAFR